MKRSWSCLSILPLLAIALTPAFAQEKEQVVFAELFDGKLAKGWSWVREDPKAWRIDNGTLVSNSRRTAKAWENRGGGRACS